MLKFLFHIKPQLLGFHSGCSVTWQQDVCCYKGASHFSRYIYSEMLFNAFVVVRFVSETCTGCHFKLYIILLVAAKFRHWTDKQTRTLKVLFGFEELAPCRLHSWSKAFICRLHKALLLFIYSLLQKGFSTQFSFCNKGAQAILIRGTFPPPPPPPTVATSMISPSVMEVWE